MISCTYHNPESGYQTQFRLSTRHRTEHVFYSRVLVSYMYSCSRILQLYASYSVRLDLQFQFSTARQFLFSDLSFRSSLHQPIRSYLLLLAFLLTRATCTAVASPSRPPPAGRASRSRPRHGGEPSEVGRASWTEPTECPAEAA